MVRQQSQRLRGRLPVPLCGLLAAALAAWSATGQAQQPAPAGMPPAQAAARRFPQPVRVGDLLRRRVLRPVESQPTLGRVRDIVRRADGSIAVVMEYGGVFGLFTRPVAVPVEAMALLGEYMEVIDLTPDQLDRLAPFDGAGATALPPDSVIRVGLARPSH